MFNLLMFICLFSFSKEPLRRDKTKNINTLVLNSLEYSIIVDEDGFYPKKIYINSGTSLDIRIANLLNKDITFTNSKLNIYAAIRPKSSNNLIIKINEPGLYEFNCAINKLKMLITVD